MDMNPNISSPFHWTQYNVAQRHPFNMWKCHNNVEVGRENQSLGGRGSRQKWYQFTSELHHLAVSNWLAGSLKSQQMTLSRRVRRNDLVSCILQLALNSVREIYEKKTSKDKWCVHISMHFQHSCTRFQWRGFLGPEKTLPPGSRENKWG